MLSFSVLEPKRLELLLVPTARTISLLVNPGNPNIRTDIPETQRAAEALGRHLEVLTASTENEIDAAFATVKGRCAACNAGSILLCSASSACCTGGAERDACYISIPRVRRHRRPNKLWDPLRVPVSANGHASRKDSQGRHAGRSPHPTEHAI